MTKSAISAKPNPFQRVISPLRQAREQFPRATATATPRAVPIAQSSPEVIIDYRDRISVATWLLVFGMGLRLLFTLPQLFSFDFNAFGSPISIPITDYVVTAALLSILAAACTQSVIAVHPSFDRRFSRRNGASWVFWALPIAVTILSVVLLPLAPSRTVQVLGLLVYAVVIATIFFSLYATVEVGQVGYRRGRALLNTLAYGSALLLFVIVYQTRTRSLLSGTMVAVTAALLTIELLRGSTPNAGTVVSYGLAVGMVLGQATWALNYWPIVDLTGGLLLALIFYLMVGIAQQGLQGRLQRRVLLEYGLFALIALVLIAALGSGFRDLRTQNEPILDLIRPGRF